MYVFVHCKCVCLFQVLECLCVNNWWLSAVPAEIHYPSSSLVYCSVEDVFPSEADSFMIGDEGLGLLVKEKWPGKNSEPADPLARLSFYIAEMVNVTLLEVFLVQSDRVEKLEKIPLDWSVLSHIGINVVAVSFSRAERCYWCHELKTKFHDFWQFTPGSVTQCHPDTGLMQQLYDSTSIMWKCVILSQKTTFQMERITCCSLAPVATQMPSFLMFII